MSTASTVWLIPLQANGTFFTITADVGRFAFLVPYKPHPAVASGCDPRYSAKPVKGLIAELAVNVLVLPPQIRKAYLKWQDTFAKSHPDRFNELINESY